VVRKGPKSGRREYIDEALRRLQPVAGVDAVGMTTNAGGRMRLIVEGTPALPLQDRPIVLHSSVSEGYARAIGMRLIAGRWVTDTEPIAVFVVNESLARRYFPGEDPIGKRNPDRRTAWDYGCCRRDVRADRGRGRGPEIRQARDAA